MLKHQLIHPQINDVLGRAGHHATILIADGHFPASTKKGPNAEVVTIKIESAKDVAELQPLLIQGAQMLHRLKGLPAGEAFAARFLAPTQE